MAKTVKKASVKEQPPIGDAPPGNDWQEVGDFWDSMYIFDDDHTAFTGIYRQSVDKIGPNESMVHIFERDGIRVGVWGSSVLDRRMASAKPGHATKVQFCGMAISNDTGRSYKEFKIWQQKQPVAPATETDDDIPF